MLCIYFLKLEMYCSDDTLYRPTYKSGHSYMRARQLITQNIRYSETERRGVAAAQSEPHPSGFFFFLLFSIRAAVSKHWNTTTGPGHSLLGMPAKRPTRWSGLDLSHQYYIRRLHHVFILRIMINQASERVARFSPHFRLPQVHGLPTFSLKCVHASGNYKCVKSNWYLGKHEITPRTSGKNATDGTVHQASPVPICLAKISIKVMWIEYVFSCSLSLLSFFLNIEVS